jgi:hypothetical protein
MGLGGREPCTRQSDCGHGAHGQPRMLRRRGWGRCTCWRAPQHGALSGAHGDWRMLAAAQVGPLYVLASAAALIFANLGTRKPGEASAYSVFNGFRELPGQLNAAAMDDQLRRGQL